VQRTLHVLHNSEQPASAFAILESGNKVVPLIADGLFDLLMYKMSSVYTNKMQKMESKGPRFEIGDFCVKLGSVTINQNFKGVLVEVNVYDVVHDKPKPRLMTLGRPSGSRLSPENVEYRPCVVPGSAWELMREFLQGFLGSTVSNQAPQYLQ
ncbi:unnamed protein product, partial [Heterotrigona itama]